LGIAVDPSAWGHGHGRMLMNFLHDAARERGATQVRLKVDPQNHRAVKLYRSLGYMFPEKEDQQLIGFLALAPAGSPEDDCN
jgi:ribosomal protein S18 acetylase RimI-like enzyme